MRKMLNHLPRNFIVETFLMSPNYISYAIQWLQDAERGTSDMYSVVKRQTFSKSNNEKNERKVLDVIKQTMDKYNIDLFELAEGEFEIASIRSMYVIALITGRVELAQLIVTYGTDVMGDFLVGSLICRGIIKTLPYEYISLVQKYEDLAIEFELLAIKILEKCTKKNLSRTEDLIIRELPHWGKHSCIELAILGHSKQFVAHSTVQLFMKSLWLGTLNHRRAFELTNYIRLASLFQTLIKG